SVACRECAAYPRALIGAVGLSRSWLREYIEPHEEDAIQRAVENLAADDLSSWRWAEQPIGLLVKDSLLWFLRKSALDGSTHDREIYRRFLVAGALVAAAAPRLLARVRPDTIVQLNGTFFAE